MEEIWCCRTVLRGGVEGAGKEATGVEGRPVLSDDLF